MGNLISWSYTRLKDFEQCARMFQGKYVTKEFPSPDFEAYHLKRGKMIHTALENFLKTGDWDYLDPDKTTLLTHTDEAGNKKCVLNVPLNFLKPLLTKLRSSKFLDVEDEKAFDCDLNPVSWYDKRVWVRIIMDVMALSEDGTLVILDWKSGKIFNEVDQLRICAGGAMALMPGVQKVLVAYIWLDHPHAKPLIAEYTRDDFDAIWQEFGDRSEMIQLALESGVWEPSPSAFNCKWCPALPTQCRHKLEYMQ